jgi:hypothetical protein
MAFLRGTTDVLNRQATEMYARGLSVRDVEDALQDATARISSCPCITDRRATFAIVYLRHSFYRKYLT